MELHAPSHWRHVDFISDLHLQSDAPQTFLVWGQYLQQTAADAIVILGDLFEVWVGDDVLAGSHGIPSASFEKQCVQMLRDAAQRTNIYIMRGNRDFLMGEALMKACACTLLEDPCVLEFGMQRWLLTHGDALCLDDKAYMGFRAIVRSAQWQAEFLKKPLQERLDLARNMRAQSESLKQAGTVYADVDPAAALLCLQANQAAHLIHGHTHRPGHHRIDAGHERWVLSDWDADAKPPRAEVLRLSCPPPNAAAPFTVQRISPLAAGFTGATPGD